MLIVNGERFNDKEFHNGEVIFEKPVINKGCNVIEMYFKDNRDITALAFCKAFLDDFVPDASCELIMYYCPYERMDREINKQMFSMKYFAAILAKLKFDRVRLLDPHSNVCIAELKEAGIRVSLISISAFVEKAIEDFRPDFLCYPDKGAERKYSEVLRDINIPHFYGKKTRDLANQGHITDYELVDAPNLEGCKVLIVDDICCLGGTAYNAAKLIKEAGADEVGFYISHCEDGIFAGHILKPESDNEEHYMIDKVYTVDTMKVNGEHKNLIKLV